MTEDRFNDLERRILLLEDFAMGPESWVPLMLQNSWINDATGYNQASFIKTREDIVWVRGLITSGTIVDGTVIATLKAGYRPKLHHVFAAYGDGGISRIDVESTGDIKIYFVPSNNYLSLNSIRFSIR